MKDVLVSRATGGGRHYGGEAGLPLRGNWWEDEVCLVDVHQTVGLFHAGKGNLTEIIFKLYLPEVRLLVPFCLHHVLKIFVNNNVGRLNGITEKCIEN